MGWVKLIGGLLMCVAGVALGVYVGAWVCFVGGIKQVVWAVQQHPIPPMTVATGVLRFVCTGICAYISCALLAVPGYLLIRKA